MVAIFANFAQTRDQKRRFIRTAIDLHGFRWLVFEVAASGFFTDSYNLFATNVILPSIAFLYWPDAEYRDQSSETLINCATLGGSLIGQLVFGYLADREHLFSLGLQKTSLTTSTDRIRSHQTLRH